MEGSAGGFHFIKIDGLSRLIGVPEVALRFFISLLSGLLFAVVYNIIVKSLPRTFKHLYFTACGLLISYFCFGLDFLHMIVTLLVSYVSLVLFGGSMSHVIFSFLFQMGYLLTGYIMTASDSYDVKWTTPQCIVCLRMIGLAWDVYDGQQSEEKLSADQKTTCLKRIPSFLEIFGYSYFFGGFLVGPQFAFRRYDAFINETLIDKEAAQKGPSRYYAGMKRLMIGIIVLYTYTMFDPIYRPDSLLSDDYREQTFYTKTIQMTLVYLVQYSKYLIVWMISESICMFCGISYNGVDSDGNVKWDGLRNFSSKLFFFGPTFQTMVDGFNTNTNKWVGRYVFRRLRFLGNKSASHIGTLAFLAIWHGFYVGYFITFGLEFFVMIAERQILDFCFKLFGTTFAALPTSIRIPLQAVLATWKCVGCAYCSMSFIFLRWRRIKIVYSATYYWMFILLLTWYISAPLLRKIFLKSKKDEDKEKKQ